MRTNELDIGLWLVKTEGDAAAVLAMDATLQAHAGNWLVREVTGLLRRTFSRLDVSSRSLFALIEPGSCFAGSFRAGAGSYRSYTLALPGRCRQGADGHRQRRHLCLSIRCSNRLAQTGVLLHGGKLRWYSQTACA
ncbi:MAG: hypothetical protein IPM99_07310 [Rubrivivax sp.]|nr:hypothetical protein [Rubrivivax sp.]